MCDRAVLPTSLPPRLDDLCGSDLCSQARDLAEAGHADRAAELYERVVADAGPRYRAQAALGLAVVRDHLGTLRALGKQTRQRLPPPTRSSPHAPPTTWRCCAKKKGDSDAAARAWQTVVEFGNQRYLGAAITGWRASRKPVATMRPRAATGSTR